MILRCWLSVSSRHREPWDLGSIGIRWISAGIRRRLEGQMSNLSGKPTRHDLKSEPDYEVKPLVNHYFHKDWGLAFIREIFSDMARILPNRVTAWSAASTAPGISPRT